jgi:thioredoxin-related protein
VSVLKKPEVTAKYSKHFLGAHADFGELELDDKDPLHAMVKRHNPRKLRPVLVFLDGAGKEVARLTGGLKTVDDALLLDRYVAEKHYLKGGDFSAFKRAQKG